MTTRSWPDPNAPRGDVDVFVRKNNPVPEELAPWGYADLGVGARAPHEAPPISNGPSTVCNGCGLVRIALLGSPFCKTCRSTMPGT